MTPRSWQRPEILLFLMAAAVPLSFATWQALLNNFAVDRAAFGGKEIGYLQSIREIPGFLAFLVVYVLLVIREQRLALLSLFLLGLGTAVTGYFPSVLGLYLTTLVMSLGYHYYETLQTSLALQWVEKEKAPHTLGRLIAVSSFAGLVAFGLVYVAFDTLGFDYRFVYLLGGGVTVAIAGFAWFAFPRFKEKVPQRRTMVLRRRYWLYYALTFISGARRQIFMVFASFMMVERFGYSVAEISLLFLLNGALNVFLAPKIGKLIGRWGERRALTAEYLGLIAVFTAYGIVEDATIAAALYVIDHLFYAMAIAIKTYFQKIADPSDIASTAGVAFTINHIAAVVIPAVFGFIYILSPSAVFFVGAGLAVCSLALARNIPPDPAEGNEVLVGKVKPVAAAAE